MVFIHILNSSVLADRKPENSMDVSFFEEHYLYTVGIDNFLRNLWMPEKQKDLVSVSSKSLCN